MSTRQNERGFSLIELMVVVTVIGVIAGLAVPSLIASRAAAQQAAAISTLRSMVSIEHTYWVSRGRFARLLEVNQFQNGGLGPIVGNTLVKQGYVFQTVPAAPTDAQLATQFTMVATGRGTDGITPTIFMADETGVISQIAP